MRPITFFLLLFAALAGQAQDCTFSYQYHSNEIKAGTFTFTDPANTLSFDVPASAGYLVAANNPYFQSTKATGPIPNGTWEIYAVKNEAKSILRLRPTADVVTSGRDGFLIHGVGEDSTPEQSSLGCIIITDRSARAKLVKAFKKYGVIKVRVKNIVTSDDGVHTE